MKNTEIVKAGLYLLFNEYRNNSLPNNEFIKRLKRLCEGNNKKTFWWRFFSNDTGANDGNSVAASLESKKNTEYLNECIDIALNEKSLIVFYS